MKYLIVNADDFGLTKSINEGIAKAYKEGIVTSSSLMPTGEAFEDALDLIKDFKLDSIGAHLSLTETTPVADSAKIPTLIAKDNKFYKNHNEFFINFLLHLVKRDQIYIELKAQLEVLKKAGIKIASLSSHEHIHMLPEMLDIFVELAKEYDIPALRYPHKEMVLGKFDVKKRYKAMILSFFDKGMEKVLNESGMKHTDHFLGFLDSGRLREDTLIDMFKSLEEGSTELVCHPGFLGPEILDRYRFHINCEQELSALTSPRVKKFIKDSNISLITYREFAAKK